MHVSGARSVCMALGWTLAFGLGPPLFAFSNGDFESGSFAGWLTMTGASPVSPTVNLVSTGFAPDTNNNLSRVDQGSFSCELYSGYSVAIISQAAMVPAASPLLQFRCAAVLDGFHAAQPDQDSSLAVLVSTTSTAVYQATYRYAASPLPLTSDGVPLKKHLPWTTTYVNLSAYVGLTVTVKFTASHCVPGSHVAYAYIDKVAFVTPTPTPTPTPPPLDLKLYPPNPNPANQEVWLPYNLNVDADVNIQLWTISGEPLRSLHPGWRRAGMSEDVWDLKNSAGSRVGSGIFLYRVRAVSTANETQEDFGKFAVSR